jgi:hypothetical protein
MALFLVSHADAQDPADPSAQPNEHRAVDSVKFLAGGLAGLVTHEAGHLAFDVAFDARPRVEGIRFGPFPFFAIEHRTDLTPRRELTISSAGFWMQSAGSEWLLSARPRLRESHAPVAKGVLAFNVLNSLGYAIVACAKAGPLERDTRGISVATGIDERAIGAIVAAPALLDAWRYFRPEARWAVWSSRAVKIASVLLVAKRAP